MNLICGCCEGIKKLTPMPVANRPGLDAIAYRVGTHATFLETMKALLSSHYLDREEPDEQGQLRREKIHPLQTLRTREASDAAIALLDAWATVADVLTFYQDRMANEGYLRTATERRSVLELARLVGYRLRPGVASSVYLAYTLDENLKDEVVIPQGARAQSVPGPGELPQSFETSEDLKVRAKWNNLQPRRTQPQSDFSIRLGDGRNAHVYLKGISTNLKPNDPLLIDFGSGTPEFYRVKEVQPNAAADRTLVILQTAASGPAPSTASKKEEPLDVGLIKALTLRPSVQPRNSLRLARRLEEQFTTKGEAGYAAVGKFAPVLRETLATAAANATVAPESRIKVYALRLEARLFGHNVPKRTRINKDGSIETIGDWPLIENLGEFGGRVEHEEETVLYLDSRHESILPDTWVVVKKQTTRLTDATILIAKGNGVDSSHTRSEYGITAPTTRIELGEVWIQLTGKTPSQPTDDDFNALRATSVYAQPEELEIAEEPIEALVCGGTDEPIELDGFYEGLEAGRWVVVSGERDIPGTSGVKFSELAMLATVSQDVQRQPVGTAPTAEPEPRPGERLHTFVTLAENLQYCFKRDTVTIYGNVVKATHGETRKEVLGSGDGAKALQSFALKQPPLTFVSAANPSGVESTLKVFVNDVRWHETDSLVGLSPTDRNFITKTDDEGKTTLVFGNGREAARLPSGLENIKAEYRNGLGKPGNVKAGQITLLVTRPLGVKEVINPLRASGGADKEDRNQARKSAPPSTKALDRLVSVQDYEDFSRTYAGIAKARAAELTDGRRQIVHVTIAGTDDIPIDETSDLFRNLRRALSDFGDPHQPIQLAVRELMLMVISANVRIHPDYQWDTTEPKIRAALLGAFGFERRELGQDSLLSEVISVMQAVRGVAYVDIDAFGGIPEKKMDAGERRLLTPEEISQEVQRLVTEAQVSRRPKPRLTVNLADPEEGTIRPAQLAFLTRDIPATLILNQIG